MRFFLCLLLRWACDFHVMQVKRPQSSAFIRILDENSKELLALDASDPDQVKFKTEDVTVDNFGSLDWRKMRYVELDKGWRLLCSSLQVRISSERTETLHGLPTTYSVRRRAPLCRRQTEFWQQSFCVKETRSRTHEVVSVMFVQRPMKFPTKANEHFPLEPRSSAAPLAERV